MRSGLFFYLFQNYLKSTENCNWKMRIILTDNTEGMHACTTHKSIWKREHTNLPDLTKYQDCSGTCNRRKRRVFRSSMNRTTWNAVTGDVKENEGICHNKNDIINKHVATMQELYFMFNSILNISYALVQKESMLTRTASKSTTHRYGWKSTNSPAQRPWKYSLKMMWHTRLDASFAR